ncbi:MAG: bifunctional riboflavin kinase/FAD synthetase [Chloroflexi bacterium]|nr:bifunctional riboflavin kinase/FAD synthetase [Chloroflexota bacterium]
MSFEDELSALAPNRPTAVTVGTFDGVHTGHQALFKRTIELARSMRAGSSIAMVFRQQPRAILQPDRPVSYLCTLDDRLILLRQSGLDVVIPVDFDEALRSLSPREFVTALRDRLQMNHLVLGPGAALGRDRAGDASVLAGIGRELRFTVHTLPPVTYSGKTVSSSAIRAALAAGDLKDAEAMLGRRFVLRGKVEIGQHRGRTLGFPTANLAVPPQATLPGDGIYATWAEIANGVDSHVRFPAATSIGVRPTFGGGARTVEAYLIDFHGDLYGKSLALEFVARLRDELKFESAAALSQQIARDVADTKEALGIA